MAAKSLVPEAFGPLQGVRIISTGTLIAQPFAAELAAEMGAEVIQLERPGACCGVDEECGSISRLHEPCGEERDAERGGPPET